MTQIHSYGIFNLYKTFPAPVPPTTSYTCFLETAEDKWILCCNFSTFGNLYLIETNQSSTTYAIGQ